MVCSMTLLSVVSDALGEGFLGSFEMGWAVAWIGTYLPSSPVQCSAIRFCGRGSGRGYWMHACLQYCTCMRMLVDACGCECQCVSLQW